EGHFSTALQRVCDRFEEGIYGLRRIATREVGAPRDLVNELLFRQVPLLLSTVRPTGKDPNSRAGLAQPCGFAGLFVPNRTTICPIFGQRGASDGFENLAGTENGPQPHGLASKRIGSALLAIHHADRRPHRQTGAAERLDRL